MKFIKTAKKKNKKGFTLVEVMLSVAIMAIASLMIMEGFMATMNLANNSSVYAKIGGSNYKRAAEKISYYTSLPASDTSDTGRYNLLEADSDVNRIDIIQIPVTVAGVGNIAYANLGWRYTTSGYTTDLARTNLAGTEAATYSANRTTFFYFPMYECENSECEHYGERGCIRHGVKSGVTGWYCVYCEEIIPGTEGT